MQFERESGHRNGELEVCHKGILNGQLPWECVLGAGIWIGQPGAFIEGALGPGNRRQAGEVALL